MTDRPTVVTASRLWQRLADNHQYAEALWSLRELSKAVAITIAEQIPDFTDHSAKHMDALWGIADSVLTETETDSVSLGEAFILGCSFYVHDLGMGLAATKEGADELRTSQAYKIALARARNLDGCTDSEADQIALRLAARDLHAKKAENLLDRHFPGIGRYLIPVDDIREQWGEFIGLVAASHHWSLQEVDRRLGSRGRVPAPEGGEVDLGYIACCLRVIDYAHINHLRASSLDRLLRASVSKDSLRHWDAQGLITGPAREDSALVFGSMRSIKNVDGWWTFYEMASGLDKEISGVAEYLSGRTPSVDRFSLEGVKGVRSPQVFSTFVRPEGFDPVDIRFRPDSMERLVQLLGGPQLYGEDRLAYIRELLQNCRDAIFLMQSIDEAGGESISPGEIRVSFNRSGETAVLTIADNGIGMSEGVITRYLLGVAADYWHSTEFFADFPDAGTSFSPVGRFGIGFLSVFMAATRVEIETEKRGGNRFALTLSGLAHRGALETRTPLGRNGTTVRLTLSPKATGVIKSVASVVRAKAPMLPVRVTVTEPEAASAIEAGWWKEASQSEFLSFLSTRGRVSTGTVGRDKDPTIHSRSRLSNSLEYDTFTPWLDRAPEYIDERMRIVATPEESELVLCAKGFAVTEAGINGVSGLINLDDLDVDAARSRALNFDLRKLETDLLQRLRPVIMAALDELEDDSSIPALFPFLVELEKTYGGRILVDTSLPWIAVSEPPGNTRLMSPSAVRELVNQVDDVVVVYGDMADPWSAEFLCRKVIPDISSKRVTIPVYSSRQAKPGTYDEEEVIWDELPEHFRVAERSYGDHYDDAVLLHKILEVLAAAWGRDESELRMEKWARAGRTVIVKFGRRAGPMTKAARHRAMRG